MTKVRPDSDCVTPPSRKAAETSVPSNSAEEATESLRFLDSGLFSKSSIFEGCDMHLAHSDAGHHLRLLFVDGSRMDHSFAPGDLTYERDTGLIVSLVLDLKDKGRTEFALLPHSRFRSNNRKLASFLTAFGLMWYSGKLIKSLNLGRNQTYATLGSFFARNAISTAVHEYLQGLETEDSGYYSIDDDHELAISRPMYIPKPDPRRR